MKTVALTACLVILTLGLSSCGKKGELEDPDKFKDTSISQTLGGGN